MKAHIITLAAALFLCGCEPQNKPQPVAQDVDMPQPIEGKARFQVSIVGQFADDFAYRGRRGIYIIKDTETGAEYLGVSGVGVSEVGSHTTGSGRNRRTVQDER